MVRDHESEHGSHMIGDRSIAAKIGCSGETLRSWARQSERAQGVRPGRMPAEREQIKALEWENRELRQASAYSRPISASTACGKACSGLDPG